MTAESSADPAFDGLVESLLLRLREGEALDAEALAREHPAHADRLRALVPVLALVERVKTRRPPAPPAEAVEAAVGDASPLGGVPERLGRWRLRSEIGRGGMGRVFDAVDDDGRRAALKVLHPHLRAVPGIVERFLREAEMGRLLDHPLVVRTLDAGRVSVHGEDTPWIALERVEGKSLRQLLDDRGSVGEPVARAIGQGVAEALAAVHRVGLVHRDLKPENVLVTPREEVRLLDLGLALLRDASVRLSGTGDFVGTLLYAAPEQLVGLDVEPAVDLYALGLLLYELVTGRHPSALAPASSALAPVVPAPLRTVAEVSPFFEAVVTGLLETDPERRLGDAARVAALLEEGEASPWWREREAGRTAARRIVVDGTVPLIGRASETACLEDAWASALSGEGRVVLVEGDAGLGKSRLVHDWLARIEQSGVAGLRTALAEHAGGGADDEVLPLSAALRDAIGPGDLDARLARLLDEGETLARPFAQALRGRSTAGSGGLPPAAQRAAHRHLVRGLAREGPLIVIAEDLDEATEESRRLFLAMARSVERERVVLVATACPGLSPEFREALRALPVAQIVGLDPLGRDEAHDLFLAAAGGAPTTAPWHDAVRTAGGNPLCLIEGARAVRASPTGEVASPIPDALKRLLQRRVAAVDPESAHLLAIAACAGERFDPAVVCAAAGAGRLEGLRRLHRLDREHRLLAPDGEAYRFRHSLVRSVVHDDLPSALRAEIHGALARALEAAPPGNAPGARAAGIVQHALRSPDPRRALPHAAAALEFLAAGFRHREVAAVCEALLALPDGLDRRLEAQVWARLGSSRLVFAPIDLVIPPLERALALAQALADDDLILLAALELGAALGQAGRFQESLGLQRLVMERTARGGTALDRARAAVGLAASLFDLGRFAEAERAAADAAGWARDSGDASAIASAAYFVGVVRLGVGDSAGARPHLEAAVRGSHATGDPVLETSAVTALSNLEFVEGRLGEARAHLDRLIALAREEGELRAELVTRMNLATLEAALGRIGAARETAVGALESARRAGFTSVVVHAQAALAWTDLLLGAWGEALVAYEEAQAGAATLGSPVLEAKIASRRLVLLAWTGRFEEAQALHAEHARRAQEAGAAREHLALDEGWAEVLAARGDTAAAALLLERTAASAKPRRLLLETARLSLALGICRRDLGAFDAARPWLVAARDDADRMGLEGLGALARAHLATLPGGDPLEGRLALAEHADAMGVHPRLRAAAALSMVTGDAALRASASGDLERVRRSLPAAFAASMLERVPLHRTLGAPGG